MDGATKRTRRRRGLLAADAATVYDQWFVPALFEQWPDQLLDEADVRRGDTVLDVGCGTGVLARHAVARVGPAGTVIGVDPNEAMLDVARSRSPEVDWRPGVAESLPVPDDHVDHTFSQFAAMFFDDLRAAVGEFRRVTRPGGRIAVATWADIDRSPGYAALARLLRDHVGPHAEDALLAPFSLGSPGELRDAIGEFGGSIDIRTRVGTAQFCSIDVWLHTEIRGWTLADAVDDETYRHLLAAARGVLAPFVDAGGTVSFDAPALIAIVDV
jgi:SAM-dependent methyltransferase